MNTSTIPYQSVSHVQASETGNTLPWQSAKPCPASSAACGISCPPCVTKSALWCSSVGPAVQTNTPYHQHMNDYSKKWLNKQITIYHQHMNDYSQKWLNKQITIYHQHMNGMNDNNNKSNRPNTQYKVMWIDVSPSPNPHPPPQKKKRQKEI